MTRRNARVGVTQLCILLAAAGSVAVGIGCWAGVGSSGESLKVSLIACEGEGPRGAEEQRNPDCCKDERWAEDGMTSADSLSAFHVGAGGKPTTVEVQGRGANSKITLRIVTHENVIVYETVGRANGEGEVVFRNVVVAARPGVRDGYCYLVIASERGCLKRWIYLHS